MPDKTTYTIKFPFKISGGSVQAASNPSEVISSKVVFCLGSQVGERVMRPYWGVEILNSVFAMGGSLEEAVAEGIEMAFQRWFPDYQLRGITTERDPHLPTYFSVFVRYGSPDSNVDQMSKVGLRAPDGTEMF